MVTLFGEDEEKAFIVGTVQAIFFENPSNFYKVVLVNVTDTNTDYLEKEIVVTGSFGQVQEEEPYRFFGHFVDHPRYGRQFQVDSYQQERPTSASGVVNYLSSDKFPGIGKRTAEKIVEVLGESAIDRIIDDPSVLEEVTVLNEKKRQVIVETIRLNHGMEQVIVGLNRYGFGSQLAFSIYQTYQEETLSVIQENPYQLVEDIEGVGFKRADNIAEQIGIQADSAVRIRAAILHEVFEHSIRSGNTYVQADVLLEEAIRTLEASRPVEISPDQVANEIITLVEHGKIQQEETKLFENSLYFSEWGIGTSIQRLLSRKKEIHYEEEEVQKNIRMIEKRLNIQYGDSQQAAIEEAIKSPLFILTGGPGTGKTTVIAEAIYQLVIRNKRVLVASQANLAVDNALERLISNPKIRAIRLGSAKKIDSSVSNITEGNVFVVSGILNAFKNLLTYRDELMFGKDTFLCLKINDYFEIYEWKKQKFIRVDKVSEYLSANYRDLKTYSVY